MINPERPMYSAEATGWDELYAAGSIHERPSQEVVQLIPLLKELGINKVLDVGCGTGRHSRFLAEQGFEVLGQDVSRRAIDLAKAQADKLPIQFQVGAVADISLPDNSVDFVLASHSLEYAANDNVVKAVAQLNRILRPDMPILVRVVSTEHPFYQAQKSDIYGFSHVGHCIKNDLPVHFFTEDELRKLFSSYRIKRLESIVHPVDHERITVPLAEWVLFGYKQSV